MKYPPLSIIILNYNGYSNTKKCVASVLKMKYPGLAITVVDNGSQKNEASKLKKCFSDKRLRFVRYEKNYGFTEGNNKILKTIKNKYVVLLNNDVQVTDNWLKPIVKVLEENSSIAIAQPKILWAKNKRYFDYAGACGGYIDIFGYPFTRGRIFNTIEKDKGQYNTVSDVFWASGAAMVIKTNIFKKIGYFDIRFFNYMEEIDLCFRVNKAGYRIVCVPETHVFHKGAATSSKNELKKRFWEHRNNLLMITKNYTIKKLIYILPVRILMEYISIFYYLANRRVDYAAAVVLSQLSYIHMAPQILLERLIRKKKKEHAFENKIFQKSIVLHYFLLQKRTFTRLHE